MDYTVKRIDEMEGAFLGGLKRARAELGVSSFGMQVVELPPNYDGYPAHDHVDEGQEEVFVLLRGSGTLELDGESIPLDGEEIVRVGPAVSRRLLAGPEGLRVLALGGVPGRAYEPPAVTELGGPDPMARS